MNDEKYPSECPKCGAQSRRKFDYVYVGEWECESFRCTDGVIEQSLQCKLNVAKRRIAKLEGALEDTYEYAATLLVEWSWKKGERAGNAREYERLEATIAVAERLLYE